MSDDTTNLGKLDELLAAIRKYDDPRRAGSEWKLVYKLLQKASVAPGRVTGIVGMRDVASLAGVVEELRAPETVGPAGPPIDPEILRKALLAFRKRLDLTVLDDESKLGHSPLSKGAVDRDARVITPPIEWPAEVWQELTRQGKIRYVGHGMYSIPRQAT